jgi:ABC-type glutathione transport system ATPase component
VQGVKPVFL